MLNAALDAVAAAHVHVLMHAHAVERHAQGPRDLVGELGHLDGGPYVQHLAPWVPARHHAEGLDRHGGAAAPAHAIGQLVLCRSEGLVDVAPYEALVEQHVGAMRGMYRRAVRPIGGLAIEQERQRLVRDLDLLARILGQCAAIGHHGDDPFPGIARTVHGKGIACHQRCIHADQQRIGGACQLMAAHHQVHARHGQRIGRINAGDAGAGVGRGQDRDVQGSRRRHVADERGLAADEAAILAHAALAGDVSEVCRPRHAQTPPGWLAARRRSAASAIASTIWP